MLNVREISEAGESRFNRQELISWWDQSVISQARIMVVGAGAIGNEVIKNLVLLGFRHLLVCDFDSISPSNLSRTVLFRPADLGGRKAAVAVLRAREMALADDPRIDCFDGDIVNDLGLGAFAACDLVLGCLDNMEARRAVARACRATGRPFIDAGMADLDCRVSVFDGHDCPCYVCTISRHQEAEAKRRYSCDDVKRALYAEDKMATVQVAAAMVGAMQVQEAVRLLHGDRRNVGRSLMFLGLASELLAGPIAPCVGRTLYRNSLTEIVEAPLSGDMTLRHAIAYLEQHVAGPDAAIDISGERSFVERGTCYGCGLAGPIMRPLHRLTDADLACLENRFLTCPNRSPDKRVDDAPRLRDEVSRFSFAESPGGLLDLSLREVGIPPWHIITVRTADQRFIPVLLAKDQAQIVPSWSSVGLDPSAADKIEGKEPK